MNRTKLVFAIAVLVVSCLPGAYSQEPAQTTTPDSVAMPDHVATQFQRMVGAWHCETIWQGRVTTSEMTIEKDGGGQGLVTYMKSFEEDRDVNISE